MASNKPVFQLLSVLVQMGLDGGERVPFLIVGGAGIGKTATIKELARRVATKRNTEFNAEVHSAPQIQAEDVSGLPVPDLETGTTRLLPLHVGRSLGLNIHSVEKAQGVLVLDEFGSIDSSREAAFLNFFQGGRLGELELPPQVALGAIMNPADIASNGRSLSTPARNRFVWINMGFDDNGFLGYYRNRFMGVGEVGDGEGMKEEGSAVDAAVFLPTGWESKGSPIPGMIGDFLDANRNLINMEPKPGEDGAWASPRSWEMLSRVLVALEAAGIQPTDEAANLALDGCLGPKCAPQLQQYFKNVVIPSLSQLMAAGSKALELVPSRADLKRATLMSASRAFDHQKIDDTTKKWVADFFVRGLKEKVFGFDNVVSFIKAAGSLYAGNPVLNKNQQSVTYDIVSAMEKSLSKKDYTLLIKVFATVKAEN